MYGAMAAVHSGQWQHLGDLAKAAEDAGWEYIFSPEGPAADSTDSLAASLVFANATSRIKVGTSIAIIYYRHPYLTASAASNIQEVSGGRLILGLGASHRALHEPMGIEMKSPVTEMRQYVADVRRHAADRLQFPIWLAATRRPMARLAGQIADGVNIFGVPHSLLAETVETVKESSSKAGRSRQEPIMAYAQIGVADDLNIARRAARETLRFYCVFPAYQDLYTTAGYGEEIQAFLAARQRGRRRGGPTGVERQAHRRHTRAGAGGSLPRADGADEGFRRRGYPAQPAACGGLRPSDAVPSPSRQLRERRLSCGRTGPSGAC